MSSIKEIKTHGDEVFVRTNQDMNKFDIDKQKYRRWRAFHKDHLQKEVLSKRDLRKKTKVEDQDDKNFDLRKNPNILRAIE